MNPERECLVLRHEHSLLYVYAFCLFAQQLTVNGRQMSPIKTGTVISKYGDQIYAPKI